MHETSPFSLVILLGAGVVGQAIARAHLEAGVGILMVDLNIHGLNSTAEQFDRAGFHLAQPTEFPSGGHVIAIASTPEELKRVIEAHQSLLSLEPHTSTPGLLIESIVERLDAKRDLLRNVQQVFTDRVVFASNTSSLRITDIAKNSAFPSLVCGMHFFMPVKGREMVEVVRAGETSSKVVEDVSTHAIAIGKRPLVVLDSPGFVVNRILWPYLNQAVAALGSGANHDAIRKAALRVGMPMSPLELIDLIGLRTAFDAGRAAWQAFPARIEPSPILPGMIKAKLVGRSGGSGFYHYDPTNGALINPENLTDIATKVIDKYLDVPQHWTEEELYQQLAVALWVEAALVMREGLVADADDISQALDGGLACNRVGGFWQQFDALGCPTIMKVCQEYGSRFKALSAPPELLAALETCDSPDTAMKLFVARAT